MDTIAVFVNDADHARRLLEPMLGYGDDARWVLVACAPRLTCRIGKWSAHASREQYRQKWCQRLFEELQTLFPYRVPTLIAKSPLQEVVQDLRRRFGDGLHVLDARRPKLGAPVEALGGAGTEHDGERWAVPIAVSSWLSMMLALAD